MTDKNLAPSLKEIASFLDGSAALDGVWFGDPHPDHYGINWWRPILVKAIEESQAHDGEVVYQLSTVIYGVSCWIDLSKEDFDRFPQKEKLRITHTAPPRVVDEAMLSRAENAYDSEVVPYGNSPCDSVGMKAALKAALERTDAS